MHVICVVTRRLRRLRWNLCYPERVYNDDLLDAYFGSGVRERIVPSLSRSTRWYSDNSGFLILSIDTWCCPLANARGCGKFRSKPNILKMKLLRG